MQLRKTMNTVSAVVVLVAGVGFSGVAIASQPAEEMCGPFHINAMHECCYGNKAYSVGSAVKHGNTQLTCDQAGVNGHIDTHWSKNG
ncbi:DUF1496 domain-containing protein [Acidithiobacillus ferriphilus]|uniref:DUF1496 domain-containing protein n=1 Tax=Acidithiobacillus ferriphilus TaxID=1689834 RepID=UPI001C05FC8B|nr:DUF1496 domain-containing protein [Acidithiobacillus ferriphilus]MBU2785239.1 DUF1496 domain-containing protein [Acidithiobacillus ferriphilus]